jgi:hypothetical protein
MFVAGASKLSGMNIDRTIAEIEYLERMFAAPDTRPLSLSDLAITRAVTWLPK